MVQNSQIICQTEAARAASKRYREKNKLKIRAIGKEWRKNNLELCRLRQRERYQKDKEKHIKYTKTWLENHPKKVKVKRSLSHEKWYKANKEKILKDNKTWRDNNKDKVRNWHNDREKSRIWYSDKLKNDPNFRLRSYTSSRIHAMLQGKKTTSTHELLGCDIQFYKEYLEKQFQQDMTWANHGAIWEIDHIIPVSQFDLNDHKHQKLAFHWSNTRPLYKQNNRDRRDRLDQDAIDRIKELKIENLFKRSVGCLEYLLTY